ncbi:MAG: hypothetical protein H7A36_04795 [Chlamydiales bacterium]|nr:hypothetical protein [Chlamydiales bacterium]
MTTLGSYFAMRLEQLGVEHYFMVPSEISPPFENKNLKPIFCCNALNASFAADGYARARKVGVVVTSSLSALEALVDTSLPLIVISERPMMQEDSVTIHTLEEAPLQLDEALEMALTDHKAVYIEIAYSLFEETVLSEPQGILKDRTPPSNKESLQAAVEHAVHFLKDAERTTLVAGSKLRSWGGKQPFRTLADISGFPVAIQPDAKGVFPEDHPQYVGTLTQNLLDTSDAYLFVGTHLENALIKPEQTKLIDVNTHSVQVCEQLYTDVLIANFLDALRKKIKPSRLKVHKKQKEKCKKIDGETPLNLPHIFRELERALDSDMALLVDGWFNYEELQLPEGCFFEVHNTQISWCGSCA